jgi:hypothetical protein
MPDSVVSVFRLSNYRRLRAPAFNVEYRERDSDVVVMGRLGAFRPR